LLDSGRGEARPIVAFRTLSFSPTLSNLQFAAFLRCFGKNFERLLGVTLQHMELYGESGSFSNQALGEDRIFDVGFHAVIRYCMDWLHSPDP